MATTNGLSIVMRLWFKQLQLECLSADSYLMSNCIQKLAPKQLGVPAKTTATLPAGVVTESFRKTDIA